MNYNEFKEKVEDWGKKYDYNTTIGYGSDYIYMMLDEVDYSNIVFHIDELERFVIDLDWEGYKSLSENERKDLFEIVTEFAETKPENREDEKKYYLRLPIYYDNEWNYLNLDRDARKYLFSSKENIESYQTQFTQKEIEKVREEYNLDSFEIVEVEE